jgi:DNA mismatch repair protein MutS2
VSDAFAASGLDLPALRAVFERLTHSSLGLRAVRELEPRTDEEAHAAYARAAEMVRLDGAGDRPSLGGVSDPLPGLAAAQEFNRPLEVAELASLATFLGSALRLAAWLSVRASDVPALVVLAHRVPSGLAALHVRLAEVIDDRGRVRDDASPRLASLRRDLRELESKLLAAIERIATRPDVRNILSDPKPHRRSGRWVLAVKAKSAGRVKGVVHDRSQTGETAFVEPREALELSNRHAEQAAAERAELARILVEVSREVFNARADLERAAGAIAELELALVAADFCREFGAHLPELGAGELVLRAARHPLLVEEERRGRLERVVPIDVRLGGDFDLLVITGPNTGGKTLALKTVGAAAYCARLGLPVCCAEGSAVPLYDGLVADIGDEQEISQSLSTFASHLVRVQSGLSRATPATLVLLDELGGGTDPDEGAALGDAILAHLLERGIPTVVTTHLGRLKEFCFRNARAENASVAFDGETLEPLYRVLIGTPGESNALAIATRLGLPDAVVERARERLERRDREVSELIDQVRGAREHTERLRSAAEDRLQELERSQAGVRDREEQLERRGEQLEAEAQRGLEERVREARRHLKSAGGRLEQLPGAAALELRALLDDADRELSGASLTERRGEFLAGLKKGTFVYVPRYKKRCLVKRVDRAKGEVTVLMGHMKVSLSLEEITWHEGL